MIRQLQLFLSRFRQQTDPQITGLAAIGDPGDIRYRLLAVYDHLLRQFSERPVFKP